jgi:hypothetical protein
MTIGTGYAYRGVGNFGMVGVMADSRLSWTDGRHAEIAIKAHDLGPRAAVVSAGTGIVGPYAAELTRSIVETSTVRPDVGPLSLWNTARIFTYFSRKIQRELREQRAATEKIANDFALVGFFEDGAPGVAELVLRPDREVIQFWRPVENHLACVTVGSSIPARLVEAAYGEAGEDVPGSRFKDWHNAIASAIWYSIRTEGEAFETVGGGITAGLCTLTHDRFVWPQVEIGGERFFRGLRVPEFVADTRPQGLIRWEADIEYVARLDQRVEESILAGTPIPPGGKLARRTCTYESTLDEFIGASPIRRTPEPPEINGAPIRLSPRA